MKINFANVKVYTSINHKNYDMVDFREEIANAIFRFGQGIKDHQMAHKVYESKAEQTEYTDEEVQTIRNIIYNHGNPVMIEAIQELLSGEKE